MNYLRMCSIGHPLMDDRKKFTSWKKIGFEMFCLYSFLTFQLCFCSVGYLSSPAICWMPSALNSTWVGILEIRHLYSLPGWDTSILASILSSTPFLIQNLEKPLKSYYIFHEEKVYNISKLCAFFSEKKKYIFSLSFVSLDIRNTEHNWLTYVLSRWWLMNKVGEGRPKREYIISTLAAFLKYPLMRLRIQVLPT